MKPAPNETLNQALKLEAAKAAAGPSARLRELKYAPDRASQPPDADVWANPYVGSAGPSGTCAGTAGGEQVVNRARERSKFR
jgi:hypothetical protein